LLVVLVTGEAPAPGGARPAKFFLI